MARVIARGVLSFGLVSIPVDINSAIEGSVNPYARLNLMRRTVTKYGSRAIDGRSEIAY